MATTSIKHGLATPEIEKESLDFPLSSLPADIAHMPSSSLSIPAVSRLDSNTFSSHEDLVSNIIESMRRSGGCVIENLMSQEALDAMEADIRPHLDQVKPAESNREDFVPSNTRMVTSLLSKSRSYALHVVGNKTFRTVSDYFLTSTLKNSWHGTSARTSTSKPQLSTTITFSIPPGTPAQGLHRDDDIYHTWHGKAAEHHLGRDTMVCFFVAGKECTKSNGATRIVPGSHLWDFSRPPPSNDDEEAMFFAAEMKPGDVFMMLGGVYHGAGSNKSANQERLVHAAFATRGYLRQEENQYLANDMDKIRALPREIQEFAGFGVSKPFMGWVDLEDPIVRVLGGEKSDEAEFW